MRPNDHDLGPCCNPSLSNKNRTDSSEDSLSSTSSHGEVLEANPRRHRFTITDEIIQTPRWSNGDVDAEEVTQKSLGYFYNSMQATGSPKGLSNASSLTFGDPRLSTQSKSVSEAFHESTGLHVEGIGGISSESFKNFITLTPKKREEEYQRCSERIGKRELDRLLLEMASKLKQRTKMGAYQIRCV